MPPEINLLAEDDAFLFSLVFHDFLSSLSAIYCFFIRPQYCMEQQSTPTRDRSAIALRNAIRTGLGRTDEQLNRIGVPSAPEDQKRARTLIRLSLERNDRYSTTG